MFKKKRKVLKYRYSNRPNSGYRRNTKRKRYSTKKQLKRTNPSLKRIKRLVTLIIISSFTAFFIYVYFFSNFFAITTIQIDKQAFENATEIERINEKLSYLIGEKLTSISTKDLEKEAITQIPELESITITKNYPRTLIINFSKYPLAANVINQTKSIKKSYVINSTGYIIKENAELPTLPTILLTSDEPHNSENALIEPEKLNYLLESAQYFEDKLGISINEIEYKKIPREVHLHTDKGFTVWLDIQRPYEDQFEKLKKALVKLDIHNEPLEYIDLRIAGETGDKIIFKRSNEKNT